MENLSVADRSNREIVSLLIGNESHGEELQKLRWEKVIEFLEISIVQRDDAEIVLTKEF